MQIRIKPEGWGQAALGLGAHIVGLAIIMALLAAPCLAQEQVDQEQAGESSDQSSGWSVDRWYIYTSVYTKHFDPDPEHVNNQKAIGVEAQMTNNWVFGLASFDNSFGQRSEYLYAGL